MVEFRPVSLTADRDFLRDMYLVRNFERESAAQGMGMVAFAEKARERSLPDQQLAAIEVSLQDPRTIAEVVVVDGRDAGFCWVTFDDAAGIGVYAELRALTFQLSFQRQGLGRMTVHRIETLAVERGAEVLRSTGVAPSDGIQRFHVSMGFQPALTVFEKRLTR